jgi:hypothetical protein
VGHVAHVGEGETCTGLWRETPKERDDLKDEGTDGRMGSKWTFTGRGGGEWNGYTWLRIGTVGRLS